MKIEVTVKQFPESVADGTLVKWHAQAGQAVARDAKLAEIETDKIVLDLAAPEAGVLVEVRSPEGTVVHSGDVIGVIDTEAAASTQAAEPSVPAPAPSAAPPPPAPAETPRRVESPPVAPAPEAAPTLSPAARKLASEQGMDPAALAGTGRAGRVTKADVLRQATGTPEPVAATAPPRPAAASPAASLATVPATAPAAPSPLPVDSRGRPEERVPMTRIRVRIAERLLAAKQQTAMLTTFNEVNLQQVMDLRSRHKVTFEKEHGVKLGFMSFFVKASTEALKKFPVLNAYLDGTDVLYHGYYDIGIAVSSPRGLVVPVLRNAGHLGFAEIEKQITDFAGKARDASLTLDDLQGGTFTITNGGVFGSMLSTPILNPPQSAILGMHSITDRPVAEKGQVVIRPMMYLALSYDHRIVDGRDAVQFLVAIKELLEDPARLLLQV